jgi:hypothetical protein
MATDVLNKTWTYDESSDSENNGLDNECFVNAGDYHQHQSPRTTTISSTTITTTTTLSKNKSDLNSTKIVVKKNTLNHNTTRNLSVNNSVNNGAYHEINTTFQKRSTFTKYTSLPFMPNAYSDCAKAQLEMENFFIKNLNNEYYESLFDEELTYLSSDLGYAEPIQTSKPPQIPSFKKQDTSTKNNISPLEHDEIIVENFVDFINPLADRETSHFNPASVPETFDLFMNNLKDLESSTKTETIFKQPNCMPNKIVSKSLSNNPFSKLGLNNRMLTSSIDKDLNNEELFNNNNTTNDKKTNQVINNKRCLQSPIETTNDIQKRQNLQNNPASLLVKNNSKISSNFKTSSPFKSKVLNTTIEIKPRENEKPQNVTTDIIDADSTKQNPIDTNDTNQVVFDATYTAWPMDDEQLKRDVIQQSNPDSVNPLNKTQDIIYSDEEAEPEPRIESNPLNRTHEILTVKSVSSTSSMGSYSSSIASSTSSLASNANVVRVLNTTRDISDDAEEKTIKDMAKLQIKPNVIAKTLIKQPSKLTPPTKSITKQSIQQVQNAKIPSTKPQQTSALPTPTSAAVAKLRQPLASATNTKVTTVISPRTTNSQSSFGFRKSVPTGSSQTVTVTSPKKPVTTQVSKSTDQKIKPSASFGGGANNQASINLNRLSTVSSTSSSSSYSSSSSKENKIEAKVKSPSVNSHQKTSKDANGISAASRVAVNCTSQTTKDVKPTVGLVAGLVPVKAVLSGLPVPQRSQLKAPTQIPTFKIPVLKNTTAVKK